VVTTDHVALSSGRLRPLILLLLTIPLFTGCDGCRQVGSDTDPKSAKSKDAPAEEFTFGGAVPLPNGKPGAITTIKPGHWFSLRQSIRSNVADQRGELVFRCDPRDPQASGQTDAPVRFSSQRPAVLPKGRTKRLDARMLASPLLIGMGDRISTTGNFSSTNINPVGQRVDHIPMRGAEYFFAILTKRPERFAMFQASDWVKPPAGEEGSPANSNNYRIVFPRASGLLALPETMLDWTSTAYLFWDDVSPSELTSEQRRALVDWLHFGGRMIVNGDTIVTELATSELAPLLPIKVDGMTDLDSDSAASLIENWSVKADDSAPLVTALVRSLNSRVAIDGELVSQATPVQNTADLLATLPVGRGEVVMSRFDLTSDWLTGWRSLDSFMNAAVLARPGRRYAFDNIQVTQTYRDDDPALGTLSFATRGPLINTSLRLASRDARVRLSQKSATVNASPPEAMPNEQAFESFDQEFVASPISGMGSWRDDSDTALYLQSLLRERAGVSIPPLPFVLKSLGLYLLILVPANYIVFWLLGRLEWAWIAVPFLALLGAGWIARTVSLDLGLARNRSEVSIVELQPGYARAHVTRFVSLYNSLSGTYSVQFDSPDVAAAPAGLFTGNADDVTATIFRHGYENGPTLANFSVPSNRTRVFHAEQLIDFGGAIRLDGDEIRNETTLALRDVVLMRSSIAEPIELATIDQLEPGSRMKINWMDRSESTSDYGLLEPFVDFQRMAPGSARLVARCEDELPGMMVSPELRQQNAVAIVLAHLRHAEKPRPHGDENLPPRKQEKDKLILESGAADGHEEVVK
jgi:hypothetical protein